MGVDRTWSPFLFSYRSTHNQHSHSNTLTRSSLFSSYMVERRKWKKSISILLAAVKVPLTTYWMSETKTNRTQAAIFARKSFVSTQIQATHTHKHTNPLAIFQESARRICARIPRSIYFCLLSGHLIKQFAVITWWHGSIFGLNGWEIFWHRKLRMYRQSIPMWIQLER